MARNEQYLTMWVAGHELSDESIRKVLSVTITDREKKASDGTLVFHDPDFSVMDAGIFKKGRRIAFLMGWRDEAIPKGPYTVKSYVIEAGVDGVPKIRVNFQDLSHKMNKKQKQRKHTGKPVDIIKKIAEEHGLGYDIENIQGLNFNDDYPLTQANMTDAKLLQTLASKYGFVWGLEGTTLYFRRPAALPDLGQQTDIPTLAYRIHGATLLSFTADAKFQSEGKRKGSLQAQKNLDLLNDDKAGALGILDVGTTRDLINEMAPQLGELMGIQPGQEGDDQEVTADGEVVKTKFNAKRGFWKVVDTVVEDVWKDDEDDTTEINSDSPEIELSKATMKLAGTLAKLTTEVLEATIEPRIASMSYRPSMALYLLGLGTRCSGEWRVSEVTQFYGEGGFKTSMKVKKRAFNPEAGRLNAALSQAEDELKTIAKEKIKAGEDGVGTKFNFEKGFWSIVKLVKKINGVKDD